LRGEGLDESATQNFLFSARAWVSGRGPTFGALISGFESVIV
jgi:hypothetical protein